MQCPTVGFYLSTYKKFTAQKTKLLKYVSAGIGIQGSLFRIFHPIVIATVSSYSHLPEGTGEMQRIGTVISPCPVFKPQPGAE